MNFPDNIQTLIDDFEFLTDWESRLEHVIDLGKALPPLSADEKNTHTRVSGCASQVWLVAERLEGQPPTFLFRGDSDAFIVKGLLAILLEIFSGRTAREIKAMNMMEIFTQLNLLEYLSPQRANGLQAMLQRIQTLVAAAENACSPGKVP